MNARIAGSVLVGVAVASFGFTAPAGAAPPGQWSTKVCTGVRDWAEALARISDDHAPPDEATPRVIKASLVDFLGEMVDATDTLLDDLESAGTPDVDQGKAIARAFRRGIGRAREIFADAQDDAEDLPTGNRARFQTRGRAIQRAIDQGGTEVQGVFTAAQSRYSSPELDRAFSRARACQALG